MTTIRLLSFVCFYVSSATIVIAQDWKMQSVPVTTSWDKDVSPKNALVDYPRPQMVRERWQNLNGLWEYAITDKNAAQPASFDGKILVPYPLESALSGVKKALLPDQHLWYKRTFTHSFIKGREKVLLHFGAVDYEATVFINGTKAGSHTGGYTAFSFDITALLRSGDNELVIKVYDPTEKGVGPHGKQVSKPENIYYTSTSGIWQTVWLETVPAAFINELVITPDIDKGILNVRVSAPEGYSAELIAMSNGSLVNTAKGKVNALITLPIKNAKLWSPADPYLYDLQVKLVKGKTIVDEVKSYFGMRKISVQKDENGTDRIFLNNKAYFNLGVLDQGFWPSGLYTAPTDEALAFDIKAIKAMGFNTIRKHIKLEPARWYYHADRLGMLVWQDMVNPNQRLPEGAKPAFEQQCKETIRQLHNYPCITTWVLFNEKWGQYDQKWLTEWIKKMDSSRLVNGHSGEYLYVNEQLRSPSPDAYISADMTDVHSYPDPMDALKMDGKARVLGEFGGIGVFIPDHQWNIGNAWGYIQEKPASLQAKYTIMNQHLVLLQKQGLSGSIYTQPFDVEGEQNGLMTYDREIIKIPFAEMRKIHQPLNPSMGAIPEVAAAAPDLTEPGVLYSRILQQYIDGNREATFLKKMVQAASQAGDKPGIALAGRDYIATLKMPLSNEDILSVSQLTKSTHDPGFALMTQYIEEFKKALGDRQFTVALMNMIYKGEMEPMIQAGSPDWNAMEEKIKAFGAPGEEIYLRAKTIEHYNKKEWTSFVSTATVYLNKYGGFLDPNEKNAFQQAIDQHR